MRQLIYLLLLFPTVGLGQVINPTPDMVFKGQLGAGRGVATDPSAYFSVGPTRGATRGVVFPRVSDTSAVVSPRVNGLFVWSVQKNAYVYWDSTGNKWKEFGGGSINDRTITINGLTQDLSANRTWTVGTTRGTGTNGYVPKFSANGVDIVNSVMFETGGRIGVGTLFPSSTMHITSPETIGFSINRTSGLSGSALQAYNSGNAFYAGVNSSTGNTLFSGSGAYNSFVGSGGNRGLDFGTNAITRMSILSTGEVKVNNMVGSGNRMVIADTAGVLSTAPLPSGSVTAVGAGVGMSFPTITSAGFVNADTLKLSSRDWRQKGIDSLAALISSSGGGTVLSVSAGTGMAFTTITNSGAVSADTNKLSTRDWRQKLADSLNVVVGRKVDTTRTITINGNTQSLSASRTWSVGTVTSAGITAGTAISVSGTNPITSSGSITVSADTTKLSTREWRQKGIDSIMAILGAIPQSEADTLIPADSVYFMRDVSFATPLNTVSYVGGYIRVVTINATAYMKKSLWNQAGWNIIASVPSNYIPMRSHYFTSPQYFYKPDEYQTVYGAVFSGFDSYVENLTMHMDRSGNIYANAFNNSSAAGFGPMVAGGIEYVSIPINITYTVIGWP